jgi:flagellar protein FlaI
VELSEIRWRVNVVLSPFGPQITITRAKERAMSIVELTDKGLCTYELAAQLWIYVEGLSIRPSNILISGEPGSGKSTLLNAMLSFIPGAHRVVVIEDTLELNTKFLENCSRMESYGGVTMTMLVKNSLRMRPDRIVIGEVRGEEARDLMTAINLGRYCMGTLHASTARETLLRLQNEPMNVPETLTNLVDVFIVLKRLNLWGKITRVIGEVVETSGMEKKVVLLSPVWTYDTTRRRAIEASPSSAYRDRLAQASGLPDSQIIAETTRRANLLRLLHTKLRLMDVTEVTKLCQLYVLDADKALAPIGVTRKELEEKPT